MYLDVSETSVSVVVGWRVVVSSRVVVISACVVVVSSCVVVVEVSA